MPRRKEKGQAVLLVVVATSIFLIGAVGLAIDGSHLYAQRQMAQAAADAAAQAGIMSIFDGTNATGANPFGTGTPPGAFNCGTSDGRTPCIYARDNGFGASTVDQVAVSFPTTAPGVSLSMGDPVNLIKVTVQRNVSTGLLRFLGPSLATINASATAAIIDVISPVPIIVTHPSMDGSLSAHGNPNITICGGPSRSIQVNSSSSTAVSLKGNVTIDLSKAGILDPGNCTTGTGADFGVWGGPSVEPGGINTGLTGHYVQPASPILDPLANVAPPAQPGGNAPPKVPLADGTGGCPPAPQKPCNLYGPGTYASGIDVKNETAVFIPGIYYIMSGGFTNEANGYMIMQAGASNGTTGSGMLVYNSGVGGFNIAGSNSAANLVGTDPNSAYKGILFFQDRNALSQSHSLGGGGAMQLSGTIYITNSLAAMNAGKVQTLQLQGGSGSSTVISGQIITSALSLGGNSGITMNLNAGSTLHVRQVALVN